MAPSARILLRPPKWPLPKAIFEQQFQYQLGILAIRLLLAHPRAPDLGCISDPQLKLQFREQSFEPAGMSTGFHPYTHLGSLRREIAIKLFRFLTVLPSPLLQFPSFSIHKRNLLAARVIIAS